VAFNHPPYQGMEHSSHLMYTFSFLIRDRTKDYIS
jgi:hypothetical protein